MKSIKQKDEGFTGLEAAIVLIAFVIVAAVFSYVVLGAGFFATQKAQETVYRGVEQGTSNLQMIGNVYGTGDGGNINNLTFYIGLAPGAPSLDLTSMKIVVTKPGSATITQLTQSLAVYDGSTFKCTSNTLSGATQQTVTIKIPGSLAANGKVNIQISPSVGASLPFTRTAPATITSSQILY